MSGRRGVVTVVLLAILAIGAVVALATGGDDEDAGDSTTTTSPASTTLPTGPASDEEVAASLLPPIGALGSDWVETAREDEPSTAEQDPDDPCAVGPIPEGFLIRGEQRRLVDGNTAETLSVTAGVVAEGAEPADLDDPLVRDCLLAGLQAAVPEGATVALTDGPTPAAPAGAEVAAARFVVTGDDGQPGGRFEFVLVQRGRAVSLGLLTGLQADATTTLDDVVVALDGPLAAGADRLH